jgi:TP901 family phage tail tape measure protein
MARSGAAASAAASNMQNNLINTINQTGKFSASIKTIASTTEAFTTSLEKNKLSMGQYFKFAGGASKTFGKFFKTEMDTIDKVARERVKTLQTQYIKLGRDASGALKSIAIRPLALDMEDLGTKTAIAAQKQQLMNQLLKQGSTNLLNFGKNTQWAGRQLMVGFTIPLAMVGTAAAKTFMKMEEQAIKFKRVYGDSMTPTAETDLMVKQIRDLATEFTKYGVAAEKTMELAATAAAAGKQGLELTAQVREANRLAVLGQVEQQDALSTTISITNAFGIAASDLAKKIDFLNAVENQTVTSIEDLTIAVPKAGPVVKQLGGDVEDLAFFLTAMKEGGINASEGANALKSGLAALINPTGKAADMLASFGINVKGIVEANKGDVKGLVVDFAKALDTLDPLSRARAIEQLFGKFQFSRLSTLFQNVIAEGTQASRVLELTGRSAADLAALSSKELGTVAASSMFKFQKAVEELKIALAPIGEIFLKLVTPLLEFGSKVLENFNKLDAGAKNFIVGLIGVVGGLGPVLIMTFGLLANGIANIIKGFMLVRNIFTKSGDSSRYLGDQTEYMTQQQLEAAGVAASLEQVHQRLEQRFTSEAIAVDKLTQALQRANNANLVYQGAGARVAPPAKRFAVGGFVSGPGTGTSDSIPAMLSNGEAVIPAKSVKKNRGLVEGLIAGNIPGFFKGGIMGGPQFLGMPRTAKQVTAGRENAEMVYQEFLKSGRFRNQQPENYVGQIQKSGGHSFPIFGLGGIYHKADGSNVFVKPVMNEVAALAELRGTIIAREAHGLIAPQQRIVVMRDPSDKTGTRRFLALESKVDPKLSTPTGKFSADQYFQQLLAASLRGDKDLSGDNIFENFLPDVGPAGVFNRASGLRDYEKNMPSVEQQATINLLGVKGGAKKAFAQSTADLIRSMTPEQYAEGMRKEVARVLPRLRQTIASLDLNDVERPFYADMISRLETAQGIDWRKFHYMHSMVQAPKPSQASSKVLKLANGIVSVPGPKGAGDVVPAMLSPGEAVVPARQSKKYAGLIQGIVADNIPGYRKSNVKPSKTSIATFDGVDFSVSGSQAQQGQILALVQDSVGVVMDKLGVDIAPRLLDILSKEESVTVDRLREIINNFDDNIIRHAQALSEEMIIEQTHGSPAKLVSAEQQRKMGEMFYASNPNATHRTMRNATEPRLFHNELVFGMPKQFNQQHLGMSGKDAADFVRQSPETVMAHLAKFGDVDPNDPGLRDFAMKMADRLEAAGTKAVSENEFYEIVSQTLGDDIDDVARSIIERAEKTFRTVQQKNEGSKRVRRQVVGQRARGSDPSKPLTTFSDEDGNVFGGGLAFTQGRDVSRSGDAGAFQFLRGKLQEKARQSGLAIGTAMEFGASQGLNEVIQRNSPPKEAIKIGKDYGLALNGALRESIPKVRVAGEAFGIAATTGMTTVSPAMMQHLREAGGRILRPYIDAQSTMVPIAKQKVSVLDKEVIATKRATDAQVLNTIAMNGAAQAALNASMRVQGLGFSLLTAGGVGLIPGMGMGGNTGQNEDPDSDPEGKSKGKFERISSGIRSTTFALTSLAGAATMAGGPVGEAAGSIMAFSGIAYALITVMDLLSLAATNSKNAMLAQIGSFLMFSKGKAGGVGFLASLKNAVTPLSAAFVAGGKGFKGFINVVKTAGLNIGRFVIAALRFVPVIGWIIGGLTLLGFIVKGIIDAKERERLATEGVSDSLISTQKELDATAEALGKEKPKSVMDRIGFGGSAQSAQEQKSIVDQARGNQAWLDEYKKDIDAMRTMSQRELQTYQNTLAIQLQATGQYTEDEIQGVIKALQLEAKRTDVSLQFKSIDITKPGNIKNNLQRFATSAMDASATSLNKTQQEESKNIATSGYYQSIISLATAFQNGVIDLKKYNDGVAEVRKSLESLGESTKKAQVQGIFDMFKDNLPETEKEFRGLLDGVSDSNQQLELMTLYTSGAIEGLAQLKDVINAFNVVSAGLGPQIDQATLDAANRVLANVRATADKNNKETAKAFKDANDNVGGTKSVFQQATESLYDNVKAIKESTKAYSLLSKEGVSASDAFKIAKDPILAAALATTKVGTGKWKELVDRIREFLAITKTGGLSEKISELFGENQKLQNMEKLSRYLQQTGLDAEQVQEVLNDPELADQLLYATGEGKKGFDQIKKTVGFIMKNKEIKISLLPLTEQFKQKMSKVTEAFSAKKNVLDIQFRIDTRSDQSIVRQAQEKINALNFQSDDYEAGLTRLQDGEEAINEKYDNRIQALDKVISANDRIANQNKEELNVFQMVARGDIAGAAAGIAQLQEQKAKDALEAKKASLEAQRTNELESLTAEVVVNGQKTRMTRNQIEENLKSIKEQIFNIEENTLEPAQRQIEKAQEKLDADTESLRILGLTEDEWLKIEANINESVTSTTAYVKQLQEALDIAKQIPGALAGTSAKGGDIVGKQDPVLETDFLKNPKLKTSTKPGSGPGGTPTTVDSIAAREAAASNRASEDSKLLAAAMSIPTYGQIFRYQAEIKKKRRGFFESEWERNDNQRNIDKFEAAPPQGYGKTTYTGQPWTDVKGPFDGVTVDGNLVQNVKWSPGGPMLRASGGYISGPGTGTSDSIPALLSNGEYVIRANAVKALGTDTLDRMNYADKNRFADGGSVGRQEAAMAARGGAKPKSNPLADIAKAIFFAPQDMAKDFNRSIANVLTGKGSGEDLLNLASALPIGRGAAGIKSLISGSGKVLDPIALATSKIKNMYDPKTNKRGLNFSYSKKEFKPEDYRDDLHTIEAQTKKGLPVGKLEWNAGTGEIEWVHVEKQFQRKGIATDMWHLANIEALKDKKILHPLHSPEISNFGRSWRDAIGGGRLEDTINAKFKFNRENLIDPRKEYLKTLTAETKFADGGFVDRRDTAMAARGRDKLFKKGGAQGFEAGFQGMMSDIGKNDIVKGFGSFLGDKTNVLSGVTRGLLGTLSLPSELMGSVAKSLVTGVGQVSRGDYLGAAGTMLRSATGGNILDAINNSYSGVLNPDEQKASLFQQAAEQVIKDKTFGAGTAESNALARIIGGSLNLAGDPLSYLGVGAAAKAVKASASAAASAAKLGQFGSAAKNAGKVAGNLPGVLGLPNLQDVQAIRSVITGASNSELKSLVSSMYKRKNVQIEDDLYASYTIGKNLDNIVFQGKNEELALESVIMEKLLGSKTTVVPTTPQGLLSAALKMDPENINTQTMLGNFKDGNLGKQEYEFLDNIEAATSINKKGIRTAEEQTDGFAEILSMLTGNQNAKKLINFKTEQFLKTLDSNKTEKEQQAYQSAQEWMAEYGQDVNLLDPRTVPIIHSTKYPINRDKDGNIILNAHGDFNDDVPRPSLHFTPRATVKDIPLRGSWSPANTKIVTPLSSILNDKTKPYGMLSEDIWTMLNPRQSLVLENYAAVRPITNYAEYAKLLVEKGLLQPGKMPPIWAQDIKNKEILYPHKNAYSFVERFQLSQLIGRRVLEGTEASTLDDLSMATAKGIIGTDTKKYTMGEHGLSDPNAQQEIMKLAGTEGITQSLHADTLSGQMENLIGEVSNKNNITGQSYSKLNSDSIELVRMATIHGHFATFKKDMEAYRKQKRDQREYGIEGATGGLMKNGKFQSPKYFANGGMVLPKYFVGGDLAKGTDIIPAMLTPGEFVMTKHAVDNYGVDNLRAINSGAAPGNSVYNGYNINVNVRSNSNPDQIANAVMTQIRQVNAQQVRGSKF